MLKVLHVLGRKEVTHYTALAKEIIEEVENQRAVERRVARETSENGKDWAFETCFR